MDKIWKINQHTHRIVYSTTSCKEYNNPSQSYTSLQWLASATFCNDTISLWAMHWESILEDNRATSTNYMDLPKMAGLCRFRMQIKSHERWLVNKKMGVSKNRGTPKWMVYNGKPYWNGWFGGTIILGNPQTKHGKKGTPFNSLQKQLQWTKYQYNFCTCHNFDGRSFKHNNMLSP